MTLTNDATEYVITTKTEADGTFVIGSVSPGTNTLSTPESTKAPDHTNLERSIAVEVDDAARVQPLGGEEGHGRLPAPCPGDRDLERFGQEIAELEDGVVGDRAALGG